jgi:PHD/YefM family antitoxin component YafN of YafNO toxin-antitoxin module
MVAQITANELKVKGITAIDELVPENDGVIITVRGKEKYVVLSIEEYNQLRELELESAIQQVRKEISEGKFKSGSIEDHLDRISNV